VLPFVDQFLTTVRTRSHDTPPIVTSHEHWNVPGRIT
jgi:hypothetical protein